MATPDGGETAAMPSTEQSNQLGERSCVLETLLWVGADPAGRAGLRYVIVDDFEQAIDCCQRRLLEDLVAPALSEESEQPEEPEERAALARWRHARARFAPDELAVRWRAAHRELAALRQEAASGYAPAPGERLGAIVQRYGLDFELGAVYALPDELAALLARVGDPFVWWDDDVERAEQERAPFDYANPAHRAILARRVREANENDDYLDDGGGVFGAGGAPEDSGASG